MESMIIFPKPLKNKRTKAELELPQWLSSKESACSSGAAGDTGTHVRSLGQEDPLKGEMEPTPVFLPGKSHGQRRLVGYHPCGCKKLGMTEHAHNYIPKATSPNIVI